MVTTNSETDQIRQMFGEAVQRTNQLVASIDEDEQELLSAAYTSLCSAIAAVVPVLKYIDGDIRVGSTHVRGIELDGALLLVRGGDLRWKHSNRTLAVERLRFRGDPDEQTLQIHYMLMVLGGKFSEALVKIDKHRESIRHRDKQFKEAATVFRG